MKTNWDARFMQLAEHFAGWSKDPEAKVGAVIVDYDHRLIGSGYNGFPRGVRDLPARYADEELKLKLVVHAEANAILNAILPVKALSLYATRFPCSECAKLIVQSGISRVICPAPKETGKWAADARFSMLILGEAVVVVRKPLVGDKV